MTGSVVDYDRFFKKYGVHYDPIKHGTPPDFGGATIHVLSKGDLPITMSNKIRHISGKHAPKFNTPEDYVKAYEAAEKSADYKSFINGRNIQDAITVEMKEVFGSSFLSRIKGYDLSGNPTVFGPSTKIVAVFRKDGDSIKPITLYPNP